ncbi:uncharacterized protein LOC122297018 [Carya illinoinensis]|uniref:uncharacterized protein LOC122297018 n=1 Tax=Carya illinoinensis TaxID=32201 RepID=UPI001C71B82A|nr:uncharacterized protein LOC122297018 [Carya illinoinensis]
MYWNIRGLGTSRGRLKKLVKSFNVKVVALAETFVDERKMDKIKKSLWLDNGCSNQEKAGKIWLLWDKSVDVHVFRVSDQFMTAKVWEGNTVILLTFVYAKCSYGLRRKLWKDLEEEAQMNIPWMILGDFNVIRTNGERRGGAPRPMIAMEEFNSWISESGLLEISTQGNQLSWCNGREGLARCWARLDRGFMNTQFLELLPQISLTYLERNTSDHSPMIVSSDQHVQRYGPSPFHFIHMWMDHEEFFNLARNCWEKEGSGSGLEKLAFKLKRMKQMLKTWNKDKFGRVEIMIRELEQRVEDLDFKLQEGYEDAIEQDLLISKIELDIWKRREESMLAQKAKVNWLKLGDNNTRYFHSVLKRRQQNQIHHMLKTDGTSFDSPEEVHEGAVEYFQNLLRKGEEGDLPDLNTLIDKAISEEENLELLKSPSVEEIQQALFSIPTESSPGPDGFGSAFYIRCWDFVKGDVIEAVKDFFPGNQFPRYYTASYVALIPKTQHPASFDKFRPISLCSVIYKVCSKVLVARLVHILPRLISPEQGAFVAKRSILENVSLTQEMVHSIHKKKNGGNVMLKVDMSKAYDQVNWKFLLHVLETFGFSEGVCGLIKSCITTPWYSILLNGTAKGFFKGERGLRQGDPL